MKMKRKGLGRGLDSLLGEETRQAVLETKPLPGDTLAKLAVANLQPGRYQPRTHMDEEAIKELSASIKAQGLIQPIVVRSVGEDRYEIIAGERRWRAVKLLGWETVPTVIKEYDDQTTMAVALIENIQREDLNAMEQARALQRLVNEFGEDATHQQVADIVGKSRATVSNLLRLMDLNDDVKTFLENGDIEMGHARALLGVSGEEQSELAIHVVANELSVRETEALIHNKKNKNIRMQHNTIIPDAEVEALEKQFAEKFALPVQIKHKITGKGKVILTYKDLAQLKVLLSS